MHPAWIREENEVVAIDGTQAFPLAMICRSYVAGKRGSLSGGFHLPDGGFTDAVTPFFFGLIQCCVCGLQK